MLNTKTYNEKVKESAEELASINSSQNDLLRPEIRKAKEREEIIKNAQDVQMKVAQGLSACIQGLQQSAHPVMPTENVVKELTDCFEKIKSYDELAAMSEKLLDNTSWKQQLNISSKCMQALYDGASVYFEQQNFIAAEQAFYAICCLDQSQYAPWVSFGHASFQNKNYQQAQNAYAMASTIGPENAWPHIWAANCFEAENDKEFAKEALKAAIEIQKKAIPKDDELLQFLEQRIKKL